MLCFCLSPLCNPDFAPHYQRLTRTNGDRVLKATMAILTNPDKEKIKRAIPKASHKIIDATACRLYIAYPDPTKWTYTGLMGAIALVDDLVGHTFFLKLVDITGTRGVLWDQELYVNFTYHQDRTFFHTFETEDCLVGLLFEDTLDAAHFYKKVTTKEKHASKQTANNKNAVALKNRLAPQAAKFGSRGEFIDANTGQRSRRVKGVLYYDDQPPPEWRLLYAELAAAGITEDIIAENREFIKDYIAKQGGPLVGLEPPIPRRYAQGNAGASVTAAQPAPLVPKKIKKAPPPPPPSNSNPPAAVQAQLSYDSSYPSSPATSAAPSAPSTPVPFAPPPPPQAPSVNTNLDTTVVSSDESRPQSPAVTPTAVDPRARFRLPPSNAVIPKVLNPTAMPQQPSHSATPEPHPYPQQPPTFQAAVPTTNTFHSAPPPLPPQNSNRSGPPPPPRAGARPGVPLPPRSEVGNASTVANGAMPPPPPPRVARAVPPPPPSRHGNAPQRTQQPLAQSHVTQAPPQVPPQLPPQLPPPQSRPQMPLPPPQLTAQPRQELVPTPAPFISPDPNHQPPKPPQRTNAPNSSSSGALQNPPANDNAPVSNAPPTPPLMPPSLASVDPPSAASVSAPPPPPPPPALPPTQTSVPPPPPPALSTSQAGGPPPPPPPPSGTLLAECSDAASSVPLPAVDSSRDALLASIRGSGLGMLKKTDKTQLEKPSVLLSEARGEPTAPASLSAPTGQPETLADALASALNKRKGKVAVSDDEDDNDDW